MTSWEKDQEDVRKATKAKPDKLGKSRHRILTFSEMKTAGVIGREDFNPSTDYLGPEWFRRFFVRFRRSIVKKIERRKNLYLSGDTFSGYLELGYSIATAALVYHRSAFALNWNSLYASWKKSIKDWDIGKTFEDVVDVDVLVLIDTPGSVEYAEDPSEMRTFRSVLEARLGRKCCTTLVSFSGRHKVKDIFDKKTAELVCKHYRKLHCPDVGVCPTRQHKEQWGDADLSKDFDGNDV